MPRYLAVRGHWRIIWREFAIATMPAFSWVCLGLFGKGVGSHECAQISSQRECFGDGGLERRLHRFQQGARPVNQSRAAGAESRWKGSECIIYL